MLSLGHQYLVRSYLFVSSLKARYRSGTLALTPGLLGLSRHAFSGLFSRKHKALPSAVLSTVEGFPGYPLELMPCSSTPVVSYTLALSRLGLLPSAQITALAFPPILLAFILTNNRLSTIIQISGLYHTACFLAYLGFGLPLPG